MLLLMTGSFTAAQDGGPQTPLAVRQENVRRMLDELEQRLLELARSLEEAEPDHARRLITALQESKQSLLRQRMSQVVDWLNSARLDHATAEQQRLVDDLTRLIIILTAQSALDDAIGEMRQLEAQLEELARIAEQQRRLADSTMELADPGRMLQQLDERIAQLERIIQRQADVVSAAHAAPARGLAAVEAVADQQLEVRRQTEQLDASDESDSFDEEEPARRALAGAIEHQQQAERELAIGRADSGTKHAAEALAQLQRALPEMQRQRRKIAEMAKQSPEELAEQQDDTADQTGDLAEQMQAGSQSSESSDASGAPTGAGQPQARQAQQHMQQAARQIRQGKPGEASEEQQEALEQLEQAEEHVRRHLQQLREQMREEMLGALVVRFTEMLERQRPLTQTTAELDAARSRHDDPATLSRSQRLLCDDLARQQQTLGDDAEQTLLLIRDEGTTIVLPEIVSQLVRDLQIVARALSEQATGPNTQAAQQRIEQTLVELIDAVQEAHELAQQQQNSQPAQPRSKEGQPPLVPRSAELRLLKAAQVRVNVATQRIEVVRHDAADPSRWQNDLSQLAERQEHVRQLAQRMAEENE
jgi:hypothetical protein